MADSSFDVLFWIVIGLALAVFLGWMVYEVIGDVRELGWMRRVGGEDDDVIELVSVHGGESTG
jgi:hypothetical protein